MDNVANAIGKTIKWALIGVMGWILLIRCDSEIFTILLVLFPFILMIGWNQDRDEAYEKTKTSEVS